MSKVAVVYWSGTGNTEAMASAVAEGAKGKGAEVSLLTASEFSADQVGSYDAIAFGCPSMGAEQLEESEFEPMFAGCEGTCTERTSPCSAPMAGATENGCAAGRNAAAMTEPTLSAIA